MHKTPSLRSALRHFTHLSVGVALLTISLAWAAKAENKTTKLGNNEDTFVFAGKCPSGEAYLLRSYRKGSDGRIESYYDYEGPVGKGTVLSETTPKVMAVRVCHQFAEIISPNYWE